MKILRILFFLMRKDHTLLGKNLVLRLRSSDRICSSEFDNHTFLILTGLLFVGNLGIRLKLAIKNPNGLVFLKKYFF